MEIKGTLAKIFGGKAEPPPNPVKPEQGLGPAAQDRQERMGQRREQRRLAELLHEADRFQESQGGEAPIPEATTPPSEQPSREHLKPGQISEEQQARLRASVERIRKREGA